jgi:hypothetical protein
VTAYKNAVNKAQVQSRLSHYPDSTIMSPHLFKKLRSQEFLEIRCHFLSIATYTIKFHFRCQIQIMGLGINPCQVGIPKSHRVMLNTVETIWYLCDVSILLSIWYRLQLSLFLKMEPYYNLSAAGWYIE